MKETVSSTSATRFFRIVVFGNPATKKNSMRLVRSGRRMIPIPSAAFAKYKASAIDQIMGQVGQPMITYPVNVECRFYTARRGRVDIANLISAIHDILVDAGVLADDNRDIIASVDGCMVLYDKENPRCEIEITEIHNYGQWSDKYKGE